MKPQTREHLAICELLGMSDGFTVISKAEVDAANIHVCGAMTLEGAPHLTRRFWMPALLSEELPEPDGPPSRNEDSTTVRPEAAWRSASRWTLVTLVVSAT